MHREPIRVLRIITRLNIGGPAREIATLCRGAEEHGFRTVLAAGYPARCEGDLFDSLDVGGSTKVRVRSLGRRLDPVRDARAFRALRSLVRRFDPHIVHTHTSKAGLLGRLAARGRSVTGVCHTFHGEVFQGHFGPLVSRTVLAAEKWLGHRTDAIVVLGPRGREHLKHHGIGGRVEVIPPGFDRGRLEALARGDRKACRRRFDVPDGTPALLALGRLARVKGIDVLLRALARCVREDARCILLIAGDGPERTALELQARELGLADTVRFLGWQDDVTGVIGAADLLVLPSRSEGYPHALVEARAAGLRVVASAVGEVPALVGEGRGDRLVPPDRADALAACLSPMLRELDGQETSRSSPDVRALNVSSEADMVVRTCALYRELLGDSESAGRG